MSDAAKSRIPDGTATQTGGPGSKTGVAVENPPVDKTKAAADNPPTQPSPEK